MNRRFFSVLFILLALVGCGGEEEEVVKDEPKAIEVRLTSGDEGVQILIVETGDKIRINGEGFSVDMIFFGFDGDWYGTPIAIFTVEGNRRIQVATTTCLDPQWRVVDCGGKEAFLALFPLARDLDKGRLEVAFGLVP